MKLKSTAALALIAMLSWRLAVRAQQAPASRTPHPEVTRAQTDRWMTELSNWGRWGKDDQLGTLNLITQEKRQQALALAKRGIVVSLEHRVDATDSSASCRPECPESRCLASLHRCSALCTRDLRGIPVRADTRYTTCPCRCRGTTHRDASSGRGRESP